MDVSLETSMIKEIYAFMIFFDLFLPTLLLGPTRLFGYLAYYMILESYEQDLINRHVQVILCQLDSKWNTIHQITHQFKITMNIIETDAKFFGVFTSLFKSDKNQKNIVSSVNKYGLHAKYSKCSIYQSSNLHLKKEL